jgi:hypothetical protein
MSRHRRLDENQTATTAAPAESRLRVSALRRIATDRKLLLLDCAVVRYAPFGPDGRTTWQLLPTFRWFKWIRQSTRESLNAHEAIEIVECCADGLASAQDIDDAQQYLRYTEYAAEADRFGYDKQRLIGSELRYAVADWIQGLGNVGPELKNVLDYYIAAFTGQCYAWAHYEPLHPEHRAVALAMIDDIFGNPIRPVELDPSWRTWTAVRLARTMYESRDFAAMPILADALEEAGCDNPDVLAHCRGPEPHVRGCWVVDLVLGKS